MNAAFDFFTNNVLQCWACHAFDHTFVAVSVAAANAYDKISEFALLLLTAFLAFYIVYIVLTKLNKQASEDPFYMKSVKPVLINSMIIVSLLGIGITLPKMISYVALEPAAQITTSLSSALIDAPQAQYEPIKMPENGFYTATTKDKVIETLKITTGGFQTYIAQGFKLISSAADLSIIKNLIKLEFGSVLETLFILLLGIYISWSFIKLFAKFMFYSLDVLMHATFFAFLFPILAVAFVFRNSDAPDWVKNIGNGSATMFQNLLGSIITLGSAIVVYVIIMAMLAGFAGDNFETPNVMHSAAGLATLVLVLGFIIGKTETMANEIKSVFGIQEKKELGEAANTNFTKLLGNAKKIISQFKGKKK